MPTRVSHYADHILSPANLGQISSSLHDCQQSRVCEMPITSAPSTGAPDLKERSR
ncbi:hypothetical protein DL89DRAFT_271671 [Linderina pennispora]|uniref:Uncharacterized protein n=1 Tax=Linderina pennispora TaxID=61395 RepID=A0A1Y1VW03_9FUNG|nr:uncharacterized protein DL89DRAFT_271671 [Linderina pennispora]ORX64934.1 hypothetical protein DL89DRAFT_271671 [Linderina pennispora]